jgi:hypothetical protein
VGNCFQRHHEKMAIMDELKRIRHFARMPVSQGLHCVFLGV